MGQVRSATIVLLLAALVSACAGQPRKVPPVKKPVVAYLPPSQNPGTAQPVKPLVPPPPPFKATKLLGMTPDAVKKEIGETDLIRQEGPMILWRYKGIAEGEADKTKACPLLVFFSQHRDGDWQVSFVDSPAGSINTCADALRRKVKG